jgi:hypothetical protein
MAVDRRAGGLSHHSSAQRRVAFRAYGAMRFLNSVQGGFEDIEGAIGAGQYEVAAYQAKVVALACLSIRSLAQDGDAYLDTDSPSFDFFSSVSDNAIGEALTLANDALGLTEATAADWLQRFRAYVDETECLLDYERPLPVLRSPEGAFGLVGLTRRWTPLLDQLGLPPLLPDVWIDKDKDAAR